MDNSSKTGQILGKDIAGVNCILPHKHKTAWDLFLKGCANNWMPTEIPMSDDIKQWKNGDITDDEKLLVKRSLGFFAGSESLVGNNLLLSGFRYVTDAECRQYILRQAFEESLHNLTIVYICDSLALEMNINNRVPLRMTFDVIDHEQQCRNSNSPLKRSCWGKYHVK